MKNKKTIANILNEMARELAGLANGGIVGVKNCRHVTLLSANIQLAREYLAQETDDKPDEPAENKESVKEDNDDGEHSDDLCEPE